jgi:hypothetical protein
MTAPVRSNNMKQCVCSYEQQKVWPHGINPLKTQLKLFYLKTPFVLRSKHFSISVVKKTNQFMLDKAKVAVGCEINTKHINTVWAECTVFEC